MAWSIGQDIVARRDRLGWGSKVIERLSADLQREFPGGQGFSVSNLNYMRAMVAAWSSGEHVEQLRYVVIELKVGEFQPEQLGQLSTYVAMVDGMVRNRDIHAPTVGLLLCTGKQESTVRYALAGSGVPVAVAEWRALPPEARAALPSAEELQTVVHEELARRLAILNPPTRPGQDTKPQHDTD
ncbi:MAG: PDDEXK nuclease domain-containing protein [Cellulomonas sp.]|jgi:hypothetical protein|nr:PDDEXK nuclease domain-containing protein [Cellulomonas sp.]